MNDTGILNIYKPAGMTSHDVVAVIRRKLGIKRVGHTGTLDPMATGVLPICAGQAARITEYLDLDYKTYRCSMILGKMTDTQDIWGQVIEERPADGIGEEDVLRAFEPFRGVIDQKPPMYSAVRVNGRRLYEYAREGKEVQVKTRKVHIADLTVEKIDLPNSRVDFSVCCSKGTYIRSLCADIGEALGCGACMSALRRTYSGDFRVEDTLTLEEIERRGAENCLLPVDTLFAARPQLTLWSGRAEKAVRNGSDVTVPGGAPEGEVRVYSEDGEFLMLGEVRDGVLHTIKSFFEV